ncbi:hypothetical protein POPTR_005G051850v4 [Populus trichocarpa]|uniref:Uncharacterized protein n=1 Tax=Populus trichocarpa TaxID=3694 RepID=A0ACC0SYH1_POPTR|nr:hypothetical protein BDE02_05G040700 [Populus trichocarpa]KAI9394101.1 hypothetical protein POPTR_005G051850v4 [Populus trichocarpa]
MRRNASKSNNKLLYIKQEGNLTRQLSSYNQNVRGSRLESEACSYLQIKVASLTGVHDRYHEMRKSQAKDSKGRRDIGFCYQTDLSSVGGGICRERGPKLSLYHIQIQEAQSK